MLQSAPSPGPQEQAENEGGPPRHEIGESTSGFLFPISTGTSKLDSTSDPKMERTNSQTCLTPPPPLIFHFKGVGVSCQKCMVPVPFRSLVPVGAAKNKGTAKPAPKL